MESVRVMSNHDLDWLRVCMISCRLDEAVMILMYPIEHGKNVLACRDKWSALIWKWHQEKVLSLLSKTYIPDTCTTRNRENRLVTPIYLFSMGQKKNQCKHCCFVLFCFNSGTHFKNAFEDVITIVWRSVGLYIPWVQQVITSNKLYIYGSKENRLSAK